MIETLASQAEARPVRFGAATNNILPCFIALDRANKRTESFFNFIIHFEEILTLFPLNYGLIKNRKIEMTIENQLYFRISLLQNSLRWKRGSKSFKHEPLKPINKIDFFDLSWLHLRKSERRKKLNDHLEVPGLFTRKTT